MKKRVDFSPTSSFLSALVSQVRGRKVAPMTGTLVTELCTARGAGEEGSNIYTGEDRGQGRGVRERRIRYEKEQGKGIVQVPFVRNYL